MPEATENVKQILEAIKKLSKEEQQQVFIHKNNKLNAKDKTIAELTEKLKEATGTIKTYTFKSLVNKVLADTKGLNRDYDKDVVKLADINSEDTETEIKTKIENLMKDKKYNFLSATNQVLPQTSDSMLKLHTKQDAKEETDSIFKVRI